MIRKLCLQIHFEVEINEPNLIEDTDIEAQEHYERQKRLYDAVVANPDALEAYQVYLLASSLECMNWQAWHEHLLGNPQADSKDILSPIVATLDEKDQAWFAVAVENGVFYEATEDSMLNCTASLTSMNILEERGEA